MAFWRIVSAAFIFGLALYVFLPTTGPASEVAEQYLTSTKEIPPLGIGTWLSDRDQVAHAVGFALESGYDHIDAALIYSTLNPRKSCPG